MGYQFFHYNAYSHEASTARLKEGHSIYSIAGEADHIEGDNNHVKIKEIISVPSEMSERERKIYKQESLKWLVRKYDPKNLNRH